MRLMPIDRRGDPQPQAEAAPETTAGADNRTLPTVDDVPVPVREIPLSQGKIALVDASDYDKVMVVAPKWFYDAKGDRARANIRVNGRRTCILMHHVVMDRKPGDPEIDHKNVIGTDNRRSNLRWSGRRQNNANRRGWGKTSKYKGVSRRNRTSGKLWIATTSRDHRLVRTYHDTEEEAYAAYCKRAAELHGEFARVA